MNNIKPYTYLIKFKPTGQCYYGSRIKNVKLGLTPEEDLMLKYTTSSKEINKLIKEHGIDAFEWEVRRKFETTDRAVLWEQRVLKRCKVLERQDVWLNKNIAGHIIATPEICKKISEANTGKTKTEEHKEKIRQGNIGKKKPPRTQEYRDLMSKLKSGENNPRFGAEVTKETRKKISKANKGREKTKEFKQMMSEIFKTDRNPGKNKSEETKTKLKEARAKQVMKPRSEESKAKTRAALKLYWENRKKQ